MLDYAEDARVQQLTAALGVAQDRPLRLQLRKLAGAMDAFLLAGTYRRMSGHHLVIATDKEEAAYLQNTLGSLLAPKEVRLLPDSFRRPLVFETLDPANVLQRTETINYLTHSKSKGEIVVTYPEALFEKVVAPEVLNEARINIGIGENLDLDFLVEVLTEYGFKREEFIYEPGHYSIRGGIIDIFSYGNDYPYRVELFDEEVESIRTFDPLNQRSVQAVDQVSIVPNINTKFRQDQKVSVFQVLPEQTVVWLKDYQLLLDKLAEAFDKAVAFGQNLSVLDDAELVQIFRDRAFIRPAEIISDVLGKPVVIYSDYRQPLALFSDTGSTGQKALQSPEGSPARAIVTIDCQ
ncbi:MAG: hypothetical protein HC821_01955, partial [Lewinella sp.]|nr:hypothetical protein [Lewinella sp.]